jgi:hypothetical protein
MGADKSSSQRRWQLHQDELGRVSKITHSTYNLPFAKNHVATVVLLVLGTNTTCIHNSYTHTPAEMTRKLSGQQGRFNRGKGRLNCLLLGRQETLQNTSFELQNSPRFHPLDPLVKAKLATRESWRRPKNPVVKANMVPKDLGQNQNFFRTSPGQLDFPPPLRD